MIMNTLKNICKSMRNAGIGIIALLLVVSCTKKEPHLPELGNDDIQMMDYIELDENKDKFSEFAKALEVAGVTDLLRTRGPFTLFAPNNEAMQAYYDKLGVSGLDAIDPVVLKKTVLNHLINAEVKTTDMSDASLPEKNAIGDYLVSDFNYEANEIIINKYAVIVNRDNLCANGYVNEVESVIEVVEENIFDKLKARPGYKIFVDALEATGISDTLQEVEYEYGKVIARIRYTMLAVPDSIYKANGIKSFEEFASKYNEGNTDYKSTDNPIYKYIDYHLLEGTYYKHDFEPNTVYYTISRNNQITITEEDGYYQFEVMDSTFTTFVDTEKNIPAKNGVIHGIDGLLFPKEASTGVYIWQFTDYPDVHAERCYRDRYISNFPDPNYWNGVKWGGLAYLQYYIKDGMNLRDADAWSTSENYFWMEFQLPVIRKGKYLIKFWTKSGPTRANCAVYIDGVREETLLLPNDNDNGLYSGTFTDFDIAVVDWKETKSHVIRFKAVSPGQLFFDHLKFDPDLTPTEPELVDLSL